MSGISKDASLMMKGIRLTAMSLAAVLFLSLPAASPLRAEGTFAAQGTDLWGGPGAKGTGVAGSLFDTIVHVTSSSAATGTIEFWAGGSLAAISAFSIPALGVANVPTPDALSGMGAFLFRVRSDTSVSAWSETFNDTASGRFGVSFAAVAASDLLNAGDEANGGGADASTSTAQGRARTNVGVLCNPGSVGACQLEVASFDDGALLGTGTITAPAGSAAQASLATLVVASAERSGLGLRLRLVAGTGSPYVIRNDNLTSDGTAIPLSVLRGSFSTAPAISFYTGSPVSGCGPLSVTLSWSTVGAVRVAISGVSGDLPPAGITTATILTTTDLVLTAFSATGQTATQPIRVTILPPSAPPTPTPASGALQPGGTITGVLPFQGTGVTTTFTRHESTGSTFVISGNTYKYTAGSTTGTDVVQLVNHGGCGAATATFTATVSAPGPPQIISFYADPASSCLTNNNIFLNWATANATSVSISNYPDAVPITGSVVISYPPSDTDPSKTFTLTAKGPGGKNATAKVTVPVDPSLEYPAVSPASVVVGPLDNVTVTVTGVVRTDFMYYNVVQMPSGGYFLFRSDGNCTYHAGQQSGVVDVIWITYYNGCGNSRAEFRATVQ
jgi:hypothetical protein